MRKDISTCCQHGTPDSSKPLRCLAISPVSLVLKSHDDNEAMILALQRCKICSLRFYRKAWPVDACKSDAKIRYG